MTLSRQDILNLLLEHISLKISAKDLRLLTDQLSDFIETKEVYRVVFLEKEDLSEIKELNDFGYRSFSRSCRGLKSFIRQVNHVDMLDNGRVNAYLYQAIVTGYSLAKIAETELNFLYLKEIMREDEIIVTDPELISEVQLLGIFPVENNFLTLLRFIEN